MRKSFLLPLVLISLYTNSQTPNLVKDIYPGIKSSFCEIPAYPGFVLNPINNGVVFNTSSNGTKYQLWYSDGSNANTFELNPNITAYSKVTKANLFNGKYYFAATTATAGTEIYMTDGTTSGTQILKDFLPGTGSGNVRLLNITSNKIYFIANDGVTGNELYISDGTTTGTVFLKDMVPGVSSPTVSYNPLINTINNNFYFTSATSAEGTELWFTDGTTSGTKMIFDIWPGTGNSVPSSTFRYLKGNNNDLFFTANNGVNGEELWFTNGTTAALMKDINPGSTGTVIEYLKYENNILFFLANDGVNGKELWRSDGTAAGTYLLHDLNPGSGSSAPILNSMNNKVYYYQGNGSRCIWESDGTAIGTSSVYIPCAATTTLVFSNSEIFKFNNALYFNTHRSDASFATDSIFLYKLTSGLGSLTNYGVYKNDGNTNAPCKAGYFDSISASQFRYEYSGWGSPTGNQITFISGGTAASTYSCGAVTIQMNFGSCKQNNLLEVNNNIVFYGSQNLTTGPVGMYSNSLSNGTAQFLSSAIAPNPTNNSSDLIPYIKHNNLIYFRGSNSGSGTELFVTDGTPSGTSMVMDIFPGTNSALNIESPYFSAFEDNFVAASSGGKLFFLANDGVTGTELWCLGSLAGIEEHQINISFGMYPNPANNNVTLKLKEHFIGGNIQLFDAVGKQILIQPINNTSEKINLNLNSGIYFVKAITKEGVSKTEKLVVE